MHRRIVATDLQEKIRQALKGARQLSGGKTCVSSHINHAWWTRVHSLSQTQEAGILILDTLGNFSWCPPGPRVAYLLQEDSSQSSGLLGRSLRRLRRPLSYHRLYPEIGAQPDPPAPQGGHGRAHRDGRQRLPEEKR